LKEKYNNKNLIVIIDEHDRGITHNLQNIDKAEKMLNELKKFYINFKYLQNNIHLLFITGVNKKY